MFSEVQVQILIKLLKAEKGLRYSEAQPEDEFVDNDLYNYHLQFLVKKGYAEKVNHLYRLTSSGKQAIHRFDSTGKLYESFKVSVLAFLTREVKGTKQVLLQKRTRHPYLGDVGVISGKVKPGEPLEAAAARKLIEETGLAADFRLLGVYRTTRKQVNLNQPEKTRHSDPSVAGEESPMDQNQAPEVQGSPSPIIEDTFFHVCYADQYSGQLKTDTDFGHNFWARFDQALKLQRKNLTASHNLEHIFTRIRDHYLDFFYFQEVLELERF